MATDQDHSLSCHPEAEGRRVSWTTKSFAALRMTTSARKRSAALVAVALVGLLAACYLPNNFKSEIRLGKTGDFALMYMGELVWAPLYRDIQQNRVKPEEIPTKIAEIQQDLQRDPNFSSIESLGNGRFKVHYERQGHLRPTDMVAFVRRNEIILQIHATPDGRVAINGNTMRPSDAQSATTSGLDVKGEFRIVTDALVKEHNATTVKPFGRYFIYIWTIENAFSPAPHFVMQREGAWPVTQQESK